MDNRSNYIYIVGVGRSGTSLLQRMMNAHPRIRILPEIHFFKQYLSNKKAREQINKFGYPAFMIRLNKDEYFPRSRLLATDVDLSPKEQEDFDISLFYRKLLDHAKISENKQFIGEKDPRLLELIDVVGDIIPNAHIIHIIRDPRDVMLSKLKASWSAKKGFILNLLLTQAQLSYGRSIVTAQTHYKEIHYEDLISNPEKILTELCNFLQIPFSTQMLDYHKHNDGLVAHDEMQWKGNTMKPIIGDNKNKWIKDLSNFQIVLIEKVCTSAFSKTTYQKSGDYNSLGLLEKIRVNAALIISKLFTTIYPIIAGKR